MSSITQENLKKIRQLIILNNDNGTFHNTKQRIQSACSEPKFSKLVPQSLLLGPFCFYLQSGHGMKREINFQIIIITTSKASGE